jgi:hypothetical protein
MAPTAQKTGVLPALLLDHSAAPRAARQVCSIYAAKAETNNKTSQVVLDRENDRTITIKDFHRDMFDQQVKKADMRAVFTEYAWDMNWCDPCAADPLSHEELRSLGVFWLTETPPDFVPGRGLRPIVPPMGRARDVLVTPMHVRDDAQNFPENLVLSETAEIAGSELTDIYSKMNLRTADAGTDGQWWQRLWTS